MFGNSRFFGVDVFFDVDVVVDRPEFLGLLGAESVSWADHRSYPVQKELTLLVVAGGAVDPSFSD